MIAVFILSIRALAYSRRTLVVAFLLVVPALLSLAFVASEAHGDGPRFAVELFDKLMLPILIPLTALIFGTSALGHEVEDRTLIYLTLKPLSRPAIALGKLLAAALAAAVPIEGGVLVMYLIAAQRTPLATGFAPAPGGGDGALAALLLAGLAGSLAYTALFLPLGLLTPRRALIGGFIYVLVWEGLAAGLSSALATVSVRRYVQGALNARLGHSPLAAVEPTDLSGHTCALVLAGIVAAGAALTAWRLTQMELP